MLLGSKTAATPSLPPKKTRPVPIVSGEEVEGPDTSARPPTNLVAQTPLDIVATQESALPRLSATVQIGTTTIESAVPGHKPPAEAPSDYYTDEPVQKPARTPPKSARFRREDMVIDEDSRTSHSSTAASSRKTRPGPSVAGTSESGQTASQQTTSLGDTRQSNTRSGQTRSRTSRGSSEYSGRIAMSYSQTQKQLWRIMDTIGKLEEFAARQGVGQHLENLNMNVNELMRKSFEVFNQLWVCTLCH